MRRRYTYYWARFTAIVALLAACAAGMVLLGDSWWQLAIAGALGVLFTQMAFLGHDAAHRQIFKSGQWNDWASLVIANLFGGLSYGWWLYKHSKHHQLTPLNGSKLWQLAALNLWLSEQMRITAEGRIGDAAMQ